MSSRMPLLLEWYKGTNLSDKPDGYILRYLEAAHSSERLAPFNYAARSASRNTLHKVRKYTWNVPDVSSADIMLRPPIQLTSYTRHRCVPTDWLTCLVYDTCLLKISVRLVSTLQIWLGVH